MTGDKENGTDPGTISAKQKFWIFLILLVAVIGLAILFATGALRFGIFGTFVYVIYVLAGLLAAFLTFGVLSSRGELHGERSGVGIQLGGAVVAFVVVAAGGGLYERYLYTPPHFDQLLVFFAENPSKPEPVTGKLVVLVGNQDFAVDLDGSGRVLIRAISSRWLDAAFQLQLTSPNYEIVSNSPTVLSANEHIRIKVQWKRTWEEPKKAHLRLNIEDGMGMKYAPRQDEKNVNFRLRAESDSALPIPISPKAKVELLNNGGVPLESFNFTVVGDRAVIPGRSVSYLHVDGMVPNDAYLRIINGRMVTVTLYYDSDVEKTDVVFKTMPFEMSEANFQDYVKDGSR